VKRQAKFGKTPAASAGIVWTAAPPRGGGEDAAAYDELSTQISSAVKPSSILEDIWVRDMMPRISPRIGLRLGLRRSSGLITSSHLQA
jgi:hypothetical protein